HAVGDWGLFPTGTRRVVVASRDSVPSSPPAEASSDPQAGVTAAAVDSDRDALPAAAVSPQGPEVTTASAHGAEAERIPLRVLVGDAVDGFRAESRHFCPSNTALNQLNMGVVGDLGTGKTQLVKSLVYQIARGAHNN